MGAQVRLLPAGGPPRAEGPGPPALDCLSVLLASSHQPLGLSYRGVRRHCRAVPPGLAASPSLGSPAVCSCSEQLFRFRLSWVRRCWMEASFFFFFFSVHGILQARILEWVAISFSRGSTQPRAGSTHSSTNGLLSCEQLERQAEFNSSTQDEARKPRTPLSSRVATRVSWSPLSGLLGVKPPVELERGLGIALQAMQEEKALSSQ